MTLSRFCAALSVTLCLIGSAYADVRPISDAERAAVEIAAAYLAGGSAAITGKLASNSRLSADEIETRLGPPAGASWELQTVVPALKDKVAVFTISYPSGIDETATFKLVNENGSYRIADIGILAQRTETKPVFAALVEQKKSADDGARQRPAAAGVLAALMCACAVFTFRFNKLLARGLIAASVAVLAVVLAVEMKHGRLIRPVAVAMTNVRESADDAKRLAALLPLRRAMAEGHADMAALPRATCTHDACREIEVLWTTQIALQQMKTTQAKAALDKIAAGARIPLVEILRGRLALFEGDAVAAAVAYENAVNMGPGRDGLWYESAAALLALGFEDRAAGYLRRLSRVGSREADVYYTLSMLAASRDKNDDAENNLLAAWQLQPAERSELVAAAPLWSVLRKPRTSTLISLSAPAEATFASEKATTRPIVLPAGAVPRISGDFLSVAIGEQELLVPGGAALAPTGTTVADAATWARSDEDRGLREYENLVAASRNAGAFTQPALRRRITRTANALASRNRWSDLAALTDELTPSAEHVPAELFFLRNTALVRLERDAEAKQLMSQLAGSKVLQRRKDARALEQLGEMLAQHDLFDQAIAMYDRAQLIRPNPYIDDRVRQLQMNKRLATKYSTHKTEHFEVRYPEDLSMSAAITTGQILEAEFKRLQKWIPVRDFKTVYVNVVWWQDFRSTYTGSDFILGFYQSRRITVPFAGVRAYIPPVVAILTHELAHAMLAQATNEQAPRWFQEGMAQRVEMKEYMPNAFNMYTDDRLLALAVIDAVMTRSPDPEMITEAYIEAQTIIRYVESKYGEQGVAKMINAYRDGLTTTEAIARVTGRTVAGFDNDLRTWGRSASRVFTDAPPIRYDVEDEGIRWSGSARGSR
jgi:tetratricopeptide (TPR) repeat protein